MKPGWNPVRRSRNIGTSKQGHGNDNRLVIPESWHASKVFWENLRSYKAVPRQVGNRAIHFLVEHTRDGWFHPCTVDDLHRVLQHLPQTDMACIDLVVLRQPKRKERILSSVWGRATFHAEIDQYSGPAIILEAQTLDPIEWPRSLGPEDVLELQRLRDDGHSVGETKRHFLIQPSLESLRATQLYRTLPHEIGHHVDYRSTAPGAWDNKPFVDKESFAHRYASSAFSQLKESGCLPFPRLLDEAVFLNDGLHIDDFFPADRMARVE